MKQKLLQRLDRYTSALEIARISYSKTNDNGWACRINELQGRIEELQYVIGLLNRQKQFK